MEIYVILATIVSGLLSGTVVYIMGERSAKKKNKLQLFTTLMQLRGTLSSNEKANAFNIIEIVYHDNKNVIEKWNELLNAYILYFSNFDLNTSIVLLNNIWDREVKLLEEMAKALKYKNIDWNTINKPFVEVKFNFNNHFQQMSSGSLLQHLLRGTVTGNNNENNM